MTKWCFNDTEFDPDNSNFVFGEKLIKKDRASKSNKFKQKNPENIPQAPITSRHHSVHETHNEVIDEVTANEDVNDTTKKLQKPSSFGKKLIISQSLLPPTTAGPDASHLQDTEARKIIRNSQNEKSNDSEDFSFIDTFLNQAKQDPESFEDDINDEDGENDVIDSDTISDVFTFNNVLESDVSGGNQDIETINNIEQDLESLARVVKHDRVKGGRISKTIIIQNNPRAHKAFGVKNAPVKFSSELKQSVSSQLRNEKEAIKSVRGDAKTISQIDQENGHFLSQPPPTDPLIQHHNHQHFGFGISEITSEEDREQYFSRWELIK